MQKHEDAVHPFGQRADEEAPPPVKQAGAHPRLSAVPESTSSERHLGMRRSTLRGCPAWVIDWRTWITLAIIICIVSVGIWQLHSEELKRQEELVEAVQRLADEAASKLRKQVISSSSATWSLGAVVKAFGENVTTAKVRRHEAAGARCQQEGGARARVRAVHWAP